MSLDPLPIFTLFSSLPVVLLFFHSLLSNIVYPLKCTFVVWFGFLHLSFNFSLPVAFSLALHGILLKP